MLSNRGLNPRSIASRGSALMLEPPWKLSHLFFVPTVNHFGESLVSDQQVADEGEDNEEGVGGRGEGHPGQALHEGSHQVARQVGGGEEQVGHVEEPGTVLDVQNVRLEREKIKEEGQIMKVVLL